MLIAPVGAGAARTSVDEDVATVAESEWDLRVSRYVTLYATRLSDIKLDSLVELPLIPSCTQATREVPRSPCPRCVTLPTNGRTDGRAVD